MKEKKVYKVEDVFKDIDGDPDNVMLQIPPEICEELNWNPGTVLNISVTEEGIILKKVNNGKE
jgi:hypothetical protein